MRTRKWGEYSWLRKLNFLEEYYTFQDFLKVACEEIPMENVYFSVFPWTKIPRIFFFALAACENRAAKKIFEKPFY